MAHESEVLELFIKPMKRLFARPPHAADSDDSAITGEYIEALKPFSRAVLEAGWKSIRESWTQRFWPTIAVSIKACSACQHALREIEKAKNPGRAEAVSGRMIDGIWQPYIGCRCARCERMRAEYYADNAWWYGFCARKYGAAMLSPAQRAALAGIGQAAE